MTISTTDTKKSLYIRDTGFRDELMALPAPLAFIDFETFSASPSPIPGTRAADAIPCQWSCHTLMEHGLDWGNNIRHDEFLWMGDWQWSPIYAFVESLYEATRDAKTILIYSSYERRCLKLCQQLARNDLNAIETGVAPAGYRVVDARGNKVPVADLAHKVIEWCDDMMLRFYDMLGSSTSGVKYWLQSPDFHHSNSIKYVYPAAADDYSRTAELLEMYNIPADGYEGLRAMGCIAKGDECQDRYIEALERPQRPDAELYENGHAPFDQDVAQQCLTYCCLDTLAMVVIYLAVLEGTEKWLEEAGNGTRWVRYRGSDVFHRVGGGDGVPNTLCGTRTVEAEDDMYELFSDADILNLPIREQMTLICPHCRQAMRAGA